MFIACAHWEINQNDFFFLRSFARSFILLFFYFIQCDSETRHRFQSEYEKEKNGERIEWLGEHPRQQRDSIQRQFQQKRNDNRIDIERSAEVQKKKWSSKSFVVAFLFILHFFPCDGRPTRNIFAVDDGISSVR